MLKINISFKGIEEKLSKKYEKIVLLPCMHSAHIHHMRYLQKNSPNLEHCVGGGGESCGGCLLGAVGGVDI